MIFLELALLAAPTVLLGYALLGYPAILWTVSILQRPRPPHAPLHEWPTVTVTVPAYNEEAAIGATIESLLNIDYPCDKLHILVVSDASTDSTDEIVRGYASRGVELLRLPKRSGKTTAENLAGSRLRGDVVVNVDASVRLLRTSLKPLARAFDDESVGVASGRDISVSDLESEDVGGEAGYVRYEMMVRDLETKVGSIVGASGCFYATRRALYHQSFPAELSRDFASALLAKESGYRSVSVAAATCLVPRGKSLRKELSRKTRTMARGIATLHHMRHLMNPERAGLFAWMLVSHKLCRWLFYLALPFAGIGLALLALEHVWARYALCMGMCAILFGLAGLLLPEDRPRPRVVALATYTVATNMAGVLAWWSFLSGERLAAWEPTRRSP